MEYLNIKIDEGNVDIEQLCSRDNFMLATSVMVTAMVKEGEQTVEELLEIVSANVLAIVENSALNILKNEEPKD
jgi:hypothetical protein